MFKFILAAYFASAFVGFFTNSSSVLRGMKKAKEFYSSKYSIGKEKVNTFMRTTQFKLSAIFISCLFSALVPIVNIIGVFSYSADPDVYVEAFKEQIIKMTEEKFIEFVKLNKEEI